MLSPRIRWAAGIMFAPAFALWTWKLLEPNPVPEPIVTGLGAAAFAWQKGLHVCGYAFLTTLALIWAPPRRKAWAVGFMMAHGVATEVLQYLLPFNRHGCVQDVLIDWFGITLGFGCYRLVARRQPTPAPAA